MGESLAELLKHARTRAGLSQDDLAACCGVSTRTVSDIERGLSTQPHRTTVRRLVDGLRLPPAEAARFTAVAANRMVAEDLAAAGRPPVAERVVGRDEDLALLTSLLRDSGTRIVTLIGPGGVGKSALASAAVADAGLRVRWVDLEYLREDELVVPAVVAAVRALQAGEGGRPVVVLDSAEHVLDGCRELPGVLALDPDVVMLVTSRSPLGLDDERVVPVEPFALPASPSAVPCEELQHHPAVALFVARAKRVRPDLSFTCTSDEGNAAIRAAASVCARLDGLPLAIEIAAAQVTTVPLTSMDRALDVRLLSLLDGPARRGRGRRRSIRATIDWGYQLLDADDQRLIRMLSVFRGGFSPEAAEAITGGEASQGLPRLVAASMVQIERGDSQTAPRYRMLDVVRTCMASELAAREDEQEAAEIARTAWITDLANQWHPGMPITDLTAWLDALEREIDNLRGAIAWCLQQRSTAAGMALISKVGRFWDLRDHLVEGLLWLERLLIRAEELQEPVDPMVWYWAGTLAVPLGRIELTEAMGLRLLARGREASEVMALARGATLISLVRSEQARDREAVELAQQGLAALGPDASQASAEIAMVRSRLLNRLGVAEQTRAARSGDAAALASAADAYRHAAELSRVVNDESGVLNAIAGLGSCAVMAGHTDDAIAHFREGVPIAVNGGHWWYAWLQLHGLAEALLRSDRPESAAVVLGIARTIGEQWRFTPYAFWDEIAGSTEGVLRSTIGDARTEALVADGRRRARKGMRHAALAAVAVADGPGA